MSEYEQKISVGEVVTKTGGDYSFQGEVRSAFQKKSGVWRYAIENGGGVVMIMNAKQLGRDT